MCFKSVIDNPCQLCLRSLGMYHADSFAPKCVFHFSDEFLSSHFVYLHKYAKYYNYNDLQKELFKLYNLLCFDILHKNIIHKSRCKQNMYKHVDSKRFKCLTQCLFQLLSSINKTIIILDPYIKAMYALRVCLRQQTSKLRNRKVCGILSVFTFYYLSAGVDVINLFHSLSIIILY